MENGYRAYPKGALKDIPAERNETRRFLGVEGNIKERLEGCVAEYKG